MSEQPDRIDVVTSLIRVAFLVNSAYAASGRETGVTPQQGQVLSLLRAKPYGMGELRDKLGLAKSTTTGLIELLERNGLVERRPGVPTPQSVQADLTEAGREVANRFYDATRRRVDALLAPLSADERATAEALLAEVVRRDDVAMIFPEAG